MSNHFFIVSKSTDIYKANTSLRSSSSPSICKQCDWANWFKKKKQLLFRFFGERKLPKRITQTIMVVTVNLDYRSRFHIGDLDRLISATPLKLQLKTFEILIEAVRYLNNATLRVLDKNKWLRKVVMTSFKTSFCRAKCTLSSCNRLNNKREIHRH